MNSYYRDIVSDCGTAEQATSAFPSQFSVAEMMSFILFV